MMEGLYISREKGEELDVEFHVDGRKDESFLLVNRFLAGIYRSEN